MTGVQLPAVPRVENFLVAATDILTRGPVPPPSKRLMFLPWWIGVYVAATYAHVFLAFCFVKRRNDFTFLLLLRCFDGEKRAAAV